MRQELFIPDYLLTFYVIKYTDHKAKSREEIKENKLKITNEIRAIYQIRIRIGLCPCSS